MTADVIDAGDDLPLTLPALWRRQARMYAERTLLVCDEERLTYSEAETRSRRLARGLLAAGAAKGSHVALLHPNGPDFIVGLLAAARIGAVAAPLSTLSTADELRWLLVHSDAAFLLAAPGFRGRSYDELLGAALPELDLSRPPPSRTGAAPWLRGVWFSGPAPEGWSIEDLEKAGAALDDDFLGAVEARVSPADRFVIIHTSGSTSSPKGVIHTHGGLIRHLDNVNQVRGYGSEDSLFATSPWFWVAGFAFGLLGTLVAGARIVVSNATAPADVLDLIERERPNMTNGYAPGVVRLAEDPSFAGRNLAFLRRGNLHPIMPPDVRPRDASLRHNIYGMTEVGGAVTMSADESDLPERMRGSCGGFLPGFEARIVDPETGKALGADEVGELWLRGPFLMEGYYGKPRSAVFEPDGWWRTGDLGRIDANGFFYVAGRRGDMIKTAGANVAPREVEAVLQDLTGGRQCVVLGLPDPQRGQVVAAVVVAERDSEVDEAQLREGVAARLSSYKVPRRIFRLSQTELPMLSSGKLDAGKLTELVQQRWDERHPLPRSPSRTPS
jgi:acyl-CoA synthetase (AMP-forming)/AMP-acid ligase II